MAGDPYDNTTAFQLKATGDDFTANIAGLTPNTWYHYRCIAQAAGLEYRGVPPGGDYAFQTLSLPSVVFGNIVHKLIATGAI
jgi:hypothetical protein